MNVILQVSVMKTAILDMAHQVMSTVPNVVMALSIFIIGYIVSKLVSNTVKKVTQKVGIDKIGEQLNEIDVVQKANMQIKISSLLSKVIYYFMMLFFAVAATSVLGIPEISNLVSDIFKFIPNLIVALIILIIGTLLADLLRKAILTALKSLGIPSAGLIASFLFYFLFINIVISALTQAKINTEFLSQNISIIIGGVVAAFAIGYGLASKDVMSNMVASFYSKNRFNIGDKISIDGETGIVSNVDKSTLTIKTATGKIVFPISQTINQKVEIHD
ncbi:MAG: mechanosensitive ion channel domain-containing protein [Saprospiraceae bacterium]